MWFIERTSVARCRMGVVVETQRAGLYTTQARLWILESPRRLNNRSTESLGLGLETMAPVICHLLSLPVLLRLLSAASN